VTVGKRVVQLRLDPNRCDRCGRCTRVCETGALKVGSSYIYVDWRACDECYRCVEACDRGAISRRESSRSAPAAKRQVPAALGSRSPRPRLADPKPVVERAAVARRKDGTAAWTLLEAFALLAVVLLAFLAKDAVLTSAGFKGLGPGAQVMARAATLTLFYLLQLGALWYLAYRRRETLTGAYALSRTGAIDRSSLVSGVLVVLLLTGTRVAGWIYGVVAMALGWHPPEQANAQLTDVFGSGAIGLALTVVLVVLVGPLIEEMIFRGLLLGAFESRWRTWVAILAQAGLFAVYHFTAWLLVPTFLLGIAAGWLASGRRTLWPAVVLHVLYNAVPVVIAFMPATT
jgi:membrane protease YdiL (CAAX protease family)/NAD-dependent dihydropyrimidine dehydrogenase PreA subunit